MFLSKIFLLLFLFQAAPPKQEQYTIVVFTAEWCGYCTKLKESFDSPVVKEIVKTHYDNDLHFIDVDDKKNKVYVDEYFGPNKYALPHIFILKRTSAEKGMELMSIKGYLGVEPLVSVLSNPKKYQADP